MNRKMRIFLCWAVLMLLTVGTVFAGHLEDIAARGTIRMVVIKHPVFCRKPWYIG